jgi:hypothetical protein
MPSKSKSQQRLMGAAYAWATGQTKDVPDYIKDVAKSFMKGGKKRGKKSLKDFAKTKHKGLPDKIKESRILNFKDFTNHSEQLNSI